MTQHPGVKITVDQMITPLMLDPTVLSDDQSVLGAKESCVSTQP